MLRQFQLSGSLAKAAGTETFNFDVDNQNQLLAALRAQNQKLDMAMRNRQIAIVATDKEHGNATLIKEGFTFGEAKTFIVGVPTEGAADGGVLEVMAVAALVLGVAAIAIQMLTKVKTNTNGSGGARSTMFNGAVNTVDQGGAIPIVYGKKVLVGSQIIAVGEKYFNTV
jgi:predicted phage tail protein